MASSNGTEYRRAYASWKMLAKSLHIARQNPTAAKALPEKLYFEEVSAFIEKWDGSARPQDPRPEGCRLMAAKVSDKHRKELEEGGMSFIPFSQDEMELIQGVLAVWIETSEEGEEQYTIRNAMQSIHHYGDVPSPGYTEQEVH